LPAIAFTGKERDAETGLDYFGARYFSGAQGRFTSPDQPFADQDETDPQSWNLYGYVRNNPLRFIDPTGRTCQTSGGTTYDDLDGKGCAAVDEANKNKHPDITVTGNPEPITWAQYFGFDWAHRRAVNQQIEIDASAGRWDKVPIMRGEIPIGPPAAATVAQAARGIKVTWKGLLHVIQRHTGGMAGKSFFGDSAAVTGLVKAAESVAATPQAGGNFVRVVDAGRTIG